MTIAEYNSFVVQFKNYLISMNNHFFCGLPVEFVRALKDTDRYLKDTLGSEGYAKLVNILPSHNVCETLLFLNMGGNNEQIQFLDVVSGICKDLIDLTFSELGKTT